MLATHSVPPTETSKGPNLPVPDSPSSGFFEFPQRRPAASSSEEAANAALLASAEGDERLLTGNNEVRLQAVLIPSGAEDEQDEGLKGKLRKAGLPLGHPSNGTADEAKSSSGNKKRFSLDALKIPFLGTRRASANSVTTISEHESGQKGAVEKPELRRSAASRTEDGAKSIEQTMFEVAYVDETITDDGAISSNAHSTPPRAVALQPSDRTGRSNAFHSPRSALSRSNSPSRAAMRAASLHRVSFSPSTDEAIEAREAALAHVAKEMEKKVAKARKDEIQRRKKEEKLLKKKRDQADSRGLQGRLRGPKSFSTSNLHDPAEAVSREPMTSEDEHTKEGRETEAIGYAPTQQPQPRLFLGKAGFRIMGAMGRGKANPVKAKVTKKQAIAARYAKNLEQLINAGMGLHPFDEPPTSPSAARDTPTSDSKGKKAAKPRTIANVDPSQLSALKSALMDVDLANHIITELRGMQIPERSDSLAHLAGEGPRKVPKDRILTTSGPENMRLPTGTKDDSELLLNGRRQSAAEDALRALESQWQQGDAAKRQEAPMSRSNAMAPLQQRTSSLAVDAAAAPPAAPKAATPTSQPTSAEPPAETAVAKLSVAKVATRPVKVVCLDCGEHEAHIRHAEHQKVAEVESLGAGSATVPVHHMGMATGAGVAALGVAATAGAYIAAKQSRNQQQPALEPKQKDLETLSVAATPAERPRKLSRTVSMSRLPKLEEGKALIGSTPVQMLISPAGTIIGTGAEMSGAFGALADLTGAAIRAGTEDMNAVRPPLDRMAIFVHWWGFELTLPRPTMNYLDTAHSISGAFLSFLQTMVASGGVPELLPFIRYISMYMDVEFKAIKDQDRGNGVCVAATWLMPLALVPRSWDYSLEGSAAAAGPRPIPRPAAPATGGRLPSDNVFQLPPLSGVTATRPQQFHKVARPDGANSSATALATISAASTPARSAETAAPNVPKRNLSPSQMAAIQAARTERIVLDLEAPTSHSRSSSVDSREGAALVPPPMTKRHSIGASLTHALVSVEEVPEGSLRVK